MFQAAYNIGGNTVSVEMIQSSILGCRLPRPGQVNHILVFVLGFSPLITSASCIIDCSFVS